MDYLAGLHIFLHRETDGDINHHYPHFIWDIQILRCDVNSIQGPPPEIFWARHKQPVQMITYNLEVLETAPMLSQKVVIGKIPKVM